MFLVKFHPLTTKGPFLDAHFGKLNKETPVGETYYIRPITKYVPPCKKSLKGGCGCGGKGTGYIQFNFKNCFPATHFNTHSISKKFKVNGNIKISPFEWDDDKAKFFKTTIPEIKKDTLILEEYLAASSVSLPVASNA